ncbi:MAG: hypothetical protein SOY60_10150 [Fusobacterium gastrosuis]|uniref:hypothetical protein n=1 Tax=Fusobacterium gastrosuis TaxID=1755100 RepID=UPI0025DB1453|nr:hypothetical protein [uncultured Fusobacterium sp.]MDY4012006.1 hypothetical protein [Fusobacterium gastrosuis]
MNIKTIIILLVLAIIIVKSLKSLWKHLKGESSCACNGCSKKSNSSNCGCNKK